MMGSRKVDKQAVTKLIERGRGVAEVEKYKEMVRAEAVKAKTTFSLTKPAKTSFADYKQMQDDLKKKASMKGNGIKRKKLIRKLKKIRKRKLDIFD